MWPLYNHASFHFSVNACKVLRKFLLLFHCVYFFSVIALPTCCMFANAVCPSSVPGAGANRTFILIHHQLLGTGFAIKLVHVLLPICIHYCCSILQRVPLSVQCSVLQHGAINTYSRNIICIWDPETEPAFTGAVILLEWFLFP